MSNWIHKHPTNSQEIEDFVNSLEPRPNGIQGGLSHGTDFHVWVREGDSGGNKYELKTTAPWGSGMAQQIEVMLEGKVRILSFNMSSPPSIWYFEETT